MMTRRGQTTAEYAIVLGVVLAALVAMQVYVRRGVNAQVRKGVDEFTHAGSSNRSWLTDLTLGQGEVTITRPTGQYEPYYAESSYKTVRDSSEEEEINLAGGTIERETKGSGSAAKETTTRKATGYQKQRPISQAD